MLDLTIHHDFTQHSHYDHHPALHYHMLSDLIEPEEIEATEIPKSMRMKFKNDVAQGTRYQRKLAHKRFNEDHFYELQYGHECDRCGKKIGIIPGDSDGYSLCRQCAEYMNAKHDFVVEEMNSK